LAVDFRLPKLLLTRHSILDIFVAPFPLNRSEDACIFFQAGGESHSSHLT
jgi:hypothetical protein